MDAKSTALLGVLAKCNPKDDELNRESQIQHILHSEECQTLSNWGPFINQFPGLLEECNLRLRSNKDLSNLSAALPLIPTCLEDIIFSIKSGLGPLLSQSDCPDFFDRHNLENLIDNLEASNGKNYSNIEPEDCMLVFDDKTIRSAKDFFLDLPSNCSDYGNALNELLTGRKYCISEKELLELETEFESKENALTDVIISNKKATIRRRLIKMLLGVTLLFVPSIVASATGILSATSVGVCSAVELLLVLLFWLMG